MFNALTHIRFDLNEFNQISSHKLTSINFLHTVALAQRKFKWNTVGKNWMNFPKQTYLCSLLIIWNRSFVSFMEPNKKGAWPFFFFFSLFVRWILFYVSIHRQCARVRVGKRLWYMYDDSMKQRVLKILPHSQTYIQLFTVHFQFSYCTLYYNSGCK